MGRGACLFPSSQSHSHCSIVPFPSRFPVTIIMNILLPLTLVSVASGFSNMTERGKRQSQFMCGVSPYRFYSDIPCEMYPICANGGFKLNIGCNNDYTCQIYNSNSQYQCCCTYPEVVGRTARRFFDQAASHLGVWLSVIITFLYTLFY